MKTAKFDYYYYFIHRPETLVENHSHNCCEIVYCVDGEGSTKVDGETYNISSGSYAVYLNNQAHNEYHKTLMSVICIGFYFNKDELKINTGVFLDGDRSVYKIIQAIKDEIYSKKTNYNVMINLLTTELLLLVDRQSENTILYDFDEMFYIKRFINENFNQNIEIDKLVSLSGYSYDHFRHLFKKKTGYSPKKYIINKRVEHAKKLLSASNMNITEIAHFCGFTNSSQFCVIFKKYQGVTPKEYRSQ